MAGDWIKCEHGLTEKPEIIRMAGALQLDRFSVAGRWQKVWEWADKNIPQDEIPDSGSAYVKMSPRDGDNIAFIDTLVGTPNFANAAHDVGWLNFRNGLIEFPNFGRHNGETAKTRARKARNQKDKRSRGRNVSPARQASDVAEMSPQHGDKTVTRGEERRGEINSPSLSVGDRRESGFRLTGQWDSQEVHAAFQLWARHYADKRPGMTYSDTEAAMACKNYQSAGWTPDRLVKAIEFSILKGAKNIIEDDGRPAPSGSGQPAQRRPYTPPLPKERR